MITQTKLRVMTSADLPAGLALSQAAGWNQISQDWRRALDLSPEGCFVAERNGRIAGTVTTCSFGLAPWAGSGHVAWIGMMLVDPAHRRQGLGRALMEHAMAFLQAQSVISIRLDATEFGKPLYKKLGFQTQFTLTRYGGEPSRLVPSTSPLVSTVEPAMWAPLIELDHETIGADRRRLLHELFSERPEEVRGVLDNHRAIGYAAARGGRMATYLGPCIAADKETGQRLLQDLLERYRGRPVMVDIPDENAAARVLLKQAGLAPQRSFARMCAGSPSCERIEHLYSSSGPEKG